MCIPNFDFPLVHYFVLLCFNLFITMLFECLFVFLVCPCLAVSFFFTVFGGYILIWIYLYNERTIFNVCMTGCNASKFLFNIKLFITILTIVPACFSVLLCNVRILIISRIHLFRLSKKSSSTYLLGLCLAVLISFVCFFRQFIN